MSIIRKFIAAILSVLLIVSAIPYNFFSNSYAATSEAVVSNLNSFAFSDIRDNWAKNSIENLKNYGIINGYSDGTFKPQKEITRAEAVSILNRVFGFSAKSEHQFSDVKPGAWYADQLLIARYAGYYSGFPNNISKADANITREDAITLLANVFNMNDQGDSSSINKFKDASQISDYAKGAVNALSGIISGYEDGTFKPKKTITRAEFCALLDSLITGYYNTTGNYEGKTFNGNVIINHDGVTLKNTVIKGNLYLASGIGNGEATIDNVTVDGTVYISGGGENSIYINNCNISEIVVNRLDGKVHVVLSGDNKVGNVAVNSESLIDLNDKSDIGTIEINTYIAINIGREATVSEINVNSGANGTIINGYGTIKKANIEAENVFLNGKILEKGLLNLDSENNNNNSTNTNIDTNNNRPNNSGSNESTIKRVNLVDPNATTETKELFVYLNDIRGKEVLFGHQHDTDEGITITSGSNELQSDVKNDVGDFPAVFGWDTLSLEGKEKPGVPNDPVKSRENLIAAVKKIHEMGGIFTLSAHMPNFVTGGSFNDVSDDVVDKILPGGEYNSKFNEFLDNIALFANNLKDDNGNLIPILFRPFHEQNGGWFWWGAKTTTPSQYIELYRYTVEYLRDKKGVHNILYVYSPNGPFNGNEENYLVTYPGDIYVDVLGMDQYDNIDNPGTKQFLSSLVNDLSMISKLADSKGKIATLSEFGYSPQGMKVTGNGDLSWFTDVLNAIKSNSNARRIAYMLTWANFGLNGNLFVPYKNAPNLGDHELLPDFIKFYQDPYTAFLNDIKGANLTTDVVVNPGKSFMHIVTPTDNSEITTNTTKIRVRILNDTPTKVVYKVNDSNEEIPMTLDQDGYYSQDWSPSYQDNGKTAKITVIAYNGDSIEFEQSVNVFVKVPEILVKDYTFDTGIDGIQNNGTYPESMSLNIGHAVLAGDGKLEMTVTGMTYADSWQELKLQLTNIDDVLPYVNRVKFDVLIPATAASANPDATVRGIAMLPDDWDTKYGMTTTEKKITDLSTESIDGIQYAYFPVTIDLDSSKVSSAKGLAISVVGNGLNFDGTGEIYVDNIQLINAFVETPTDPSLVDDFESYQGNDAALQSKWIKASGDDISVSLTNDNAADGMYAMKVDYKLGSSGYAGVTKTLGGVDWSGYNKLKFYLVPDGSNQKLVIQIKVNGIYYEAYPSLSDSTPRWEEIGFNSFTVAPWDTQDQGKVITKEDLKNVQELSIYINDAGGSKSGTLYFDGIRAINDGTGGVPNGGSGSNSTPAQPGVLYDFENGTDGWTVDQNNANATATSITTDFASSGTHSLTSNFDLSKTDGFEIDKVQAIDLSAVKKISIDIKLSNGTATATLYIKTGSSWTWYDSGWQPINSGGFTTLSIDLDPSKINNLENVQSIGVKIVPDSGQTGNSNVYLDNVVLSN
ncbi:glycosyl hydrolase [Thermoanaerobacterium thermosaccharolyticum]|uniref:glycosyl hydrolase n=1 Tax=Thermoanaerobacterium thermosaccharolyticum TaxID=1517 RepID=UPI003DA7DF63